MKVGSAAGQLTMDRGNMNARIANEDNSLNISMKDMLYAVHETSSVGHIRIMIPLLTGYTVDEYGLADPAVQ